MPQQGRLIALEGIGGPSMAAAASRLERLHARRGRAPGVSTWDASGIFFEVREGSRNVEGASPRTLLLLYAADLAFRLRWQITPELEAGGDVIAAPYVETAFSFGRAAGIRRRWLKDLFRFAPAPHAIYRVAEERHSGPGPQPADSFLEFAFQQLRQTQGRWNTDDVRREFLTSLERLESKGKCRIAPQFARARAAT